MTDTSGKQGNITWSTRLTFILAAVGFAVGLGNIWRFPYITGENGGGAFVLIYLVCAFGIGVPLVMSEWAIGRRAGRSGSASSSFGELAVRNGLTQHWAAVGGMAIIAVFMIMLTYTVVTGWTIGYFVQAATGTFHAMDAAASKGVFDQLMGNPLRLAFWHTLVVAVIMFVNSRGLKNGIEKAVRILMPSLFVCLVIMVFYSAAVGNLGAAAAFLFTPDFSQVSGQTVLLALGQAFFSIGVAMAVMVTYGSYLDKSTSIKTNAFIVIFADTAVALLAGLAIFPLVFAHGVEPSAGTGLVFQVLPVAFGELPGGQLFGAIFFLLLIAAALTSCIGNFEPVVAWTEEKLSISRAKAVALAGGAMWLLGLLSVFSLNLLKDFHPLDFFALFEGKTIYGTLDYVSASILLPLGGLLTALFVGWRLPAIEMVEELGLSKLGFKAWQLLVRFIVPAAILWVFVAGIMN